MKIKIILIGMKACGKSTIAKILAKKLKIKFIELDEEVQLLHQRKTYEKLNFRQIYSKYGSDYFRQLEKDTLQKLLLLLKNKEFILSCGGGTPLLIENRKILQKLGKIIFLNTDKKVLLKRIVKDGIPAFFPYQNNPEKSLEELLKKRLPAYKRMADCVINIKDEKPETIAEKIQKKQKSIK